MDCVESSCRSRSVAENLKLWEEMRKGSELGVANCLRIKMDMKVGCLLVVWYFVACCSNFVDSFLDYLIVIVGSNCLVVIITTFIIYLIINILLSYY